MHACAIRHGRIEIISGQLQVLFLFLKGVGRGERNSPAKILCLARLTRRALPNWQAAYLVSMADAPPAAAAAAAAAVQQEAE